MLVVLAALIPVILLIILGIVLKRILIRDDVQWIGLELLVYYVLFPPLLIDTLGRADLASVPIAGVGGALLLSVVVMTILCLALVRPILQRFGVSGPAFSSVFQGANRWQTFIALAVANALYGELGLTLASVAVVAMIPLVNMLSVTVLAYYAAPQRLSWPAIVATIAKNPLIWGCIIGLAMNVAHLRLPGPLHEFADSLGRCTLALGLLVVGAGLQLRGLMRPQPVALLTVFLKLVLMPVMAISLGVMFGLSGPNLAIVACCSAVPGAPSAYVLARQMGGDAPLMAQILTLQTLGAVVTMPIFIALASG